MPLFVMRFVIILSVCSGLMMLFSMAIGQALQAPVMAFSANYDIWMTDLWFGMTRQLTLNGGRAEDDHPVWSPDGTRLAFMTVRRQPFNARLPNSDIALLEIHSGQVRLLRTTPAWEDAPAWSPDGQTLLISEKGTGAGGTSIYAISAQPPYREYQVYSSLLRNDVSATWATNDAFLIHDHAPDGGRGVMIWRVDLASQEKTAVLRRTAYRPRLSPDQTTLAVWIPAFEGYALAIWRDGMASPQPLSQSYPNPLPFTWTADGQLWVAVRGATGGGVVLAIDPNTAESAPVFDFPVRINGIAWRP
jgi:dipeptidyl aminopeptidase/acylaminoacyl peptidase